MSRSLAFVQIEQMSKGHSSAEWSNTLLCGSGSLRLFDLMLAPACLHWHCQAAVEGSRRCRLCSARGAQHRAGRARGGLHRSRRGQVLDGSVQGGCQRLLLVRSSLSQPNLVATRFHVLGCVSSCHGYATLPGIAARMTPGAHPLYLQHCALP
jgi:hypothetical protein